MRNDWEVWRGKDAVTLHLFEEDRKARFWRLVYAAINGFCELFGGRLCCWRLTYRFWYPLENWSLRKHSTARKTLSQFPIDPPLANQLTHDWEGWDNDIWDDDGNGDQTLDANVTTSNSADVTVTYTGFGQPQ
jgi:hypothetical protein